MREYLVIQLGARGANIGSSFWRQISAEHGIANNAFIEEQLKHQNDHKWNTFFREQTESKITPRSVVIDLDSNNGNDVSFAQYPDHYEYEDEFIISREKGSALSAEEVRQIEETILKQIERCDGLGGCLIIRDSTEITSRLISRLMIENTGLSKKHLSDFSISADRNSTDQQIVNTAYSQPLFFNEYYPVRFLLQDVAIQRQVRSNHQSKLDLNRFVAKTLSSFTESDRRNNAISRTLSEIGHMDPYPSINYTIPSFATPMCSMPCETDPLSESLIAYSMHNESLLCDVDFTRGYYMRVHMFVRGLQSRQVQDEVDRLKQQNEMRFVSWCPTGLKVGLSDFKNCYDSSAKEFKLEEKSVCAALHNTAVKNIFQTWSSKIAELKRKNELRQILAENNIEEESFDSSLEALNSLILDYTEIQNAEEDPLADDE